MLSRIHLSRWALLTRFPRGQALLMGRTRHISKWFLLSSSCQEHKRIFLWYLLWELCWAPGDKYHNKIGASLWLNPRRRFTSQACLLWVSSNLLITVQISYPGQLVPGISAHESCSGKPGLLLPPSVSPLLCLLLSSASTKCCWVCSAFYLLLVQKGTFQAPSRLNQKTEALDLNEINLENIYNVGS